MAEKSLPSRERGLKLTVPDLPEEVDEVAPLAGARIEIARNSERKKERHSRSPRGSAD